MVERVLGQWSESRKLEIWNPTTLTALGKSEEFLEDILAQQISLLGVESRRSGIRGPFQVYQQVSLPTPGGRTIFPDIVVIAASGHLLVIEVKLSVNPELRDRAVVSQIIDYASSFAALSESDLLTLFQASPQSATWGEFISQLFPNESDLDELAELLSERISTGQINLVIACDGIAPGLPDIVKGISQQEALGFDLELVEVVPHVCDGRNEILFVPSTRVSTEIVARTSVTVHYRTGDQQPSTSVETTSMEEVEKRLKLSGESRVWSPAEVEQAFNESASFVELSLLNFCKSNSYRGEYVSNAAKKFPTFGLYVATKSANGRKGKRMAFFCCLGWDSVNVYIASFDDFLSVDAQAEYRRKLREEVGAEFSSDRKEVGVSVSTLKKTLPEFQRLMIWLQETLSGVSRER